MADPFVGEIKINSFSYAPQGWAQCNGQSMQINQNQALNSLIGSRYGGDNKTYFLLPDLRGRTPVGAGTSAVTHLTPYQEGANGGAETVSLTAAQIPPHQHAWQAVTTAADKLKPDAFLYAASPAPINIYAAPGTTTPATTTISPKTIASAGAGAGHSNMQPFQVVNFCIALVGYYPPHN